MKEFFKLPHAAFFYRDGRFSIDELILDYGGFGLLSENTKGGEELKIERIYFDLYGVEVPKSEAKEYFGFKGDEMSKAEAKKHDAEDEMYHSENNFYTCTSLNYSDFIDKFEMSIFSWTLFEEERGEIEKITSKFPVFCANAIDNHQNPKLAPILLKDIIEHTQCTINDLNNIKEPNEIQQVVINHFIEKYIYLIGYLTDRYKIAYPEIFEIEPKKENKQDTQEKSNPHPRIFKDLQSYNLFSELLLKFSIKEGSHTDFSFIYRQMQYDKYIDSQVGDSEFRSWFNSNYDIFFEKTKTLDACKNANNGYRITIYDNVKQSFL